MEAPSLFSFLMDVAVAVDAAIAVAIAVAVAVDVTFAVDVAVVIALPNTVLLSCLPFTVVVRRRCIALCH